MVQVYHVEAPNPGASSHVFLAVPVMGGFPAKVAVSFWDYRNALEQAGIACDLCVLSGNCHVDDARNYLVRQFLNTKADTLIFIDADVVASGRDLVRLYRHDKDVVAGLYPYKQDEENYPVHIKDGDVYADDAGLIEIENAPTGFLKIRRHVLEALAKDAPKFYGKTENRSITRPIPRIFARTHVVWEENPGKAASEDVPWYEAGDFGDQWGGDYHFCRLWRAKGGRIYADPNFMLSHIGEKQCTGCAGAWLRKKNDLTHIEFDEMTRRLLAGQTSMDIWDRWRNSYFNAEWAPSTDFVEACYLVARDAQGPIIECGSGLSTLALAMGAKLSGQQVYCLEHDDGWHAATLNLLSSYGLDDVVILKHAPLGEYVADGVSFKWYSGSLWKPYQGFSVAVVDGPPRSKCGAREGFWRLYGDQLAQRCRVMIDDADDQAVANTALEHAAQLGLEVAQFRAGKPFMIAKRNEEEGDVKRVA